MSSTPITTSCRYDCICAHAILNEADKHGTEYDIGESKMRLGQNSLSADREEQRDPERAERAGHGSQVQT